MIGMTGGSYYLLADNGKLYTMGNNAYKQLGDGTTTTKTTWVQPLKVTNQNGQGTGLLENIVWISPSEHAEDAGGQLSAINVLTNNNKLWAWGSNSGYMIGGAVESATYDPIYMPGVSAASNGMKVTDEIIAVETSGHTTMNIKKGTDTFGYVGHRVYGSMGDGSSADQMISTYSYTTAILMVCAVNSSSYCYKPGITAGTALETKAGITSLGRAGADTDNWPMVRKGGWMALESKTKAFVPNRVAFDASGNPVGITAANFVEGMMVYDTTNKCMKIYTLKEGGASMAWHCISTQACPDGSSGGGGSTLSLNCSSAVFSPATATQGTMYNGTLTVPYTGGNGSSYTAQSFTQNGLTFTRPAGNFATGSGNIVYNVTGTPATAGSISVSISIGGQSCNGLSLTVNPYVGGPGTLALSCSSAIFSPSTATQGTTYSGTLMVPYTGGNGSSYGAQSFIQNGLTFTLPAGTFTTGSGNIVYNIAGTPATAGVTSVNISIAGQSCSGLNLSVTPAGGGILPSTITLLQDRKSWIASVYDTDYIPYTAPTAPASYNRPVAADGINESKTADYQGSITTTGFTVQIPVANVTGSGNIAAWTTTAVIPAAYTEDGQSRILELSWAAQSYTTATKFITATIKSLGGDMLAKKLDINAGIGNDYMGVLLGMFQYPYNNAGTLTGYEVRDIPGIPDRMFGLADNNGSTTSHLMLYLPVQGEDGNIWLNNNLGADYTNLMNTNFNLTQQATTDQDYLAYGSLFQWGRKGDGHELTNWNSGTGGLAATAVYLGATTGPLTEPLTTPNYIASPGGTNSDWRSPAYDTTRWLGMSGVNNPCPQGFRVPTQADQNSLANAVNAKPLPTNAVERSALRLPRPGYKSGRINYTNTGAFGYYYNSYSGTAGTLGYLSTVYGSGNTIGQGTSSIGLTSAASVRCIKN